MGFSFESKDSFHEFNDAVTASSTPTFGKLQYTYTFRTFFHPFVGELLEQLNTNSLAGVLDADKHEEWASPFFEQFYEALAEGNVKFDEFPKKEMDVSVDGPYANYNWEIFFHFPFAIAVHLSRNQRFAEAQRWFHYIFDPTATDKSYWKFLRFRQIAKATPIDEQLALLSKAESDLSPAEEQLKASLIESYEQIRDKPFQPHPVAQVRVFPYQYAVVMRYLDNLIAWGDSLFRQDTIESINEATQIYVLAANILGTRPQRIPQRGIIRPKTFRQLKDESDNGLDDFSNALVELEGQFPLVFSSPSTSGEDQTGAFGSGPALYFCVPPNPKLLGYWDTVEDRLFKIRHCMDIEGVVRQLALFDPPIDPGMLVKAAAAGISIGSILSGLNQPASPVRSPLLIQKALELAGEVRSMGAALLSAIEKGDGEALALLRQKHEIAIQRLSQDVRFLQWKQARESTEALLKGRATALERYRYYLRLLNISPDSNTAPDKLPLDPPELTEKNFDEAYSALVGQYEKTVATKPYPPLALKEEGKLSLLAGEYDELIGHADRAFGLRTAASGTEVITAGLSMIPDVEVVATPMGTGTKSRVFGGSFLGLSGRAVTAGLNFLAQNEDWQGQFASKTASYERRADELILQSNVAARELMQFGRQILGSLIAEQAVYREYENVKAQIEQSENVDEFLRNKHTNEELYAWMQGELSRLYYEYYRFAFDTARKAEQTMKRELMRPEADSTEYIKFNYWDGGRKGFLSGEALYLDIKRMELAYHEHNKRELELTRHISLRQLNPMALLTLKATSACQFTIPEWFLDLGSPGHYMRRLKNVSVSTPSVAGPFTSVSCTLSLLSSSIRRSPLPFEGEYVRQGSEDTRFVDYFGTTQSIVTSTGSNDGGMFETNLRDERFLPFEGAGAESTWRLELPAAFRQFDYDTISDVILHVRYTARDGGAGLREDAETALKELVKKSNAAGLSLMLSLRHDFPNEWHAFVAANAAKPDPGVRFSATVKRTHFPYFTQSRGLIAEAIQIVAITSEGLDKATLKGPAIATFASQLHESDKALFEPDLTGTVKDVLDPDAAVFIVIKYVLE